MSAWMQHVCVCICMLMHVCMHVHTHVRMYVRMYVCMSMYVRQNTSSRCLHCRRRACSKRPKWPRHTRWITTAAWEATRVNRCLCGCSMYVYLFLCLCMSVCMDEACVDVCVCIYIYVCMYAYMYLCLYVCVYVYVSQIEHLLPLSELSSSLICCTIRLTILVRCFGRTNNGII